MYVLHLHLLAALALLTFAVWVSDTFARKNNFFRIDVGFHPRDLLPERSRQNAAFFSRRGLANCAAIVSAAWLHCPATSFQDCQTSCMLKSHSTWIESTLPVACETDRERERERDNEREREREKNIKHGLFHKNSKHETTEDDYY